jgi:prolyl-tRNA synthetase
MLLTGVGEDTLVLCDNCDFKANLEAAASVVDNSALSAIEPLALVPTPDMATSEEVAGFLNPPHKAACKAVVSQKTAADAYVIVFVRGDLEVNETKLRQLSFARRFMRA